jgi:hypothetical protein
MEIEELKEGDKIYSLCYWDDGTREMRKGISKERN